MTLRSATFAGPHGRNAASHRGPEQGSPGPGCGADGTITCFVASERSARSLSERFAESSNECRLVRLLAATGAPPCLKPVTRDGDDGGALPAGGWLPNSEPAKLPELYLQLSVGSGDAAEPSSASPAPGGAGRGPTIESAAAAIENASSLSKPG